MGGHIKEGLELIRSVLAAVGFKLPAGPKRALLYCLLKRLQIRLRGLNFTEAGCEPDTRIRPHPNRYLLCRGCRSGGVDLIRGADFQSRHLLLALRAGEPYRLARALSFEAGADCHSRWRGRRTCLGDCTTAEELSQKVGHPHAIGLSDLGQRCHCLSCRQLEKVCCTVRARGGGFARIDARGATWELTIANRFMLSALFAAGRGCRVFTTRAVFTSAALEQGNLFAATDFALV